MKMTIDFETRSLVDLRKHGMYNYAMDLSTDVICLAVKIGDNTPKVWLHPRFQNIQMPGINTISQTQLENEILRAETIEAHNMHFEAAVWYHVMHKRYGFRALPAEKLRCSAAKAAAFALPRSLAEACKILGVPQQKDSAGWRLINKLSKPNKKGEFCEDPELITEFVRYCIQDTEAEHALSRALPELSPSELELWRLDHKINVRGFNVDRPSIQNLIHKIGEYKQELTEELQEITDGYLNSPQQVGKTVEWLGQNGLEIPDLRKETVRDALSKNISENVRRVLEIRQAVAKSSVSKLQSMLNFSDTVGRVRGSIIYHGAATGRFTGKGVQPHNFPRTGLDDKDIDLILNLDYGLVNELYGCTFQAASQALRAMIMAKPGHSLICADFASIEARVLAWLAGEDKVLNVFRNGGDIYLATASDIYGIPVQEVTKDQRDVGKVAELAFGYQGYTGAFQAMARGYGVEKTDDEAAEIANSWRSKRPNIVKYWKSMEECAINAVKHGKTYSYGSVSFATHKGFLHCRLPSGRMLSYFSPRVESIDTKFQVGKETVTFWGRPSTKDKIFEGDMKWGKMGTYGGKLTENVVQATARDLLCESMKRLDRHGFNIVFHVHDEIVAEIPEGPEDILDTFCSVMAKTPDWAAGCPVDAEGWIGKRYRK